MILSPSIRLSAIGLRSSRVSRLSVERPAQWDEGLSVGLRSGAKDFGCHAEQISKRMKEASLAPLISAGREVRYLNSGKDNKQQIDLEIAARDAIVGINFDGVTAA